MRTIILAPHLDDGAYSCGGWIWEQAQSGEEIVVCTVFAASPAGGKIPLFARFLQTTWHLKGDPVAARRLEDVQACQFLGCDWRHLEFQDCIYRYLPGRNEPLIHKFADLSSPIHEEEYLLVDQVADRLRRLFPGDCRFFAPLGVGGHPDHRITRAAAEKLDGERYLYVDFPYGPREMAKYRDLLPAGAEETRYSLSAKGIKAWQNSIALYPSQLRSFWKSTVEMEKQVKEFAESPMGCRLWKG